MATRELMAERRRAQLVETACQCILEKGYRNFTLQDVTDRLGLSKGSLYHHFETKEELLLAVLDHLIHGWDQVIEKKLEGLEGAEEKLSALLEASFEIGRDEVSYQVLVDFWGEMDQNQAFREANTAFYARYRHQIAEIIEEGIQDGVFRQVDSAIAASMILALIDGFSLQWMFDAQAFQMERAWKACEAFVFCHLAGLYGREDSVQKGQRQGRSGKKRSSS
ncbi:MAG: TetR/AcrR family transcriptional regulator [Candidatus Tectomicrobia bacterium]|uniref:TetR/AcrR family transcriptional regulator n=1 Tax=Tectimicrobiota bacterium TaxID=2528274 RepID=A0A932CML7_UNCTE|nr:TetR/AcrR family transcriptional regulator [Candidatus Tectomicrobia bacterium]